MKILIAICFAFITIGLKAATNSNKVYLQSSKSPSQLRPGDIIELKAKTLEQDETLYRFEEIKDGILSVLQ